MEATKYGALQAASNDAGSWTLIRETEPGEWAPVARGGKLNIVGLAQELNSQSAVLAVAAAAGETNKTAEPARSRVITEEEVRSWDWETYLQHRARLYYVPRRGAGGGGHYDGSEAGIPYTGAAAQLMTGPRENHPAYRQLQEEQPRLQLQNLTAAARNVVQTWDETDATELFKEWPAMARLENLLRKLGAME